MTMELAAGLLQDMLHLKKGKAMAHAEQIEKVAARIKAQVARGNEQLGALNWLAHSMNDRRSSVGLDELVSGAVSLTQRIAHLKQVELERQPADRDATIEVDVVRLLLLLATCIEYCLNREAPKGRVVLQPVGSGKEAILSIAAGSAPEGSPGAEIGPEAGPTPPELADLEPILGSLGARLAFNEEGAGAALHLIVPVGRGEDRQT